MGYPMIHINLWIFCVVSTVATDGSQVASSTVAQLRTSQSTEASTSYGAISPPSPAVYQDVVYRTAFARSVTRLNILTIRTGTDPDMKLIMCILMNVNDERIHRCIH
jgi:hypothetical protein